MSGDCDVIESNEQFNFLMTKLYLWLKNGKCQENE